MPVGVFGVMLAQWYRRGRDPRRRPIAPRYEPPDGLTPAEVGTLVDHRVDVRDITATLVDLAVRGFIVIEEEKRDGLLWSSRDWTLRRAKPPSSDLRAARAGALRRALRRRRRHGRARDAREPLLSRAARHPRSHLRRAGRPRLLHAPARRGAGSSTGSSPGASRAPVSSRRSRRRPSSVDSPTRRR
jgi:hypothetical protein